ncbi:hypothetical protein PGT21_031462 [Puccinia graminis f. sp. tritici]|uniref:Uncharacterized protein n=1 Tax=Puccinia graminis f. sp. tritici TaxID=56615 RepID=A0A5B0S8U9_PUCGR|nr:hypothetical protein PGT21_031462 [Puccinia graminis f. sp. tritici]KAA1133925.1 hypothetical protein PGTUg99_032302 [Puccinia graminis f. sp. tritici]
MKKTQVAITSEDVGELSAGFIFLRAMHEGDATTFEDVGELVRRIILLRLASNAENQELPLVNNGRV